MWRTLCEKVHRACPLQSSFRLRSDLVEKHFLLTSYHKSVTPESVPLYAITETYLELRCLGCCVLMSSALCLGLG